jgi:serine/threonine-protein kinase
VTPAPATLAPSTPAPPPTTAAAAAEERGFLQLVVVPFADVSIDDKPIGRVSSHKLALATGSHVVALSHADYQPLRRKVSIVGGETLKLVVDLAEEAVRKTK